MLTIRSFIKLLAKPKKFIEFLSYWRISWLPRFTKGTAKLLGNATKYIDSASFAFISYEVFIRHIYKFDSEKKAPLILDCGANIGLSVIYFKQLFPDAKIIAFEPDNNAFEALNFNVESHKLKDVTTINKGVWKEETVLKFKADGAGGGRIDLDDAKQTVSIETVKLSDYLNEEIEFIKMDIEGAETDVLIEIKPLLQNVKNIFVEFHSFKNSPQTLHLVLTILNEAGFRYYIEHTGIRSEFPYCDINETHGGFDLQLNIFGYRN